MTRLPKVKTTQTLALSVGVWRVQRLIIRNRHAGLGAALVVSSERMSVSCWMADRVRNDTP